MKKIIFLCLLITLFHAQTFAQQIREQDITYSRYIVREIDLRSPGNQAIFGKGCLLSTILLDALKEGAKAYSNKDRTKQISYEQIQEKLRITSSDDSCAAAFYLPEELYVLELTENSSLIKMLLNLNSFQLNLHCLFLQK